MAVTAGRNVRGGRGYTGNTVNVNSDLASGATGPGIAQREDLANFISMITRDETPFMSSIGKTKATAIYHEWQTDQLAAPGNSKIEEGTDYITPGQALTGSGSTDVSPFGNPEQDGANIGADFAVVGNDRVRLGAYCQINGKTMAISGTRRTIDQAGVADEYAYQLKKRGTELRRDLEHDLINGQTSSASTVQRRFGSYQAWINNTATVNYAGSGFTGASSVGVGSATPTLAANPTTGNTRGALSLADIDEVMQKIYQEGGKASKVMLSPKLRRDFSDLMVTDSGVRRNIDMDGKLRQSVDIYMSDFGDLMVMPNYIMGLKTASAVNATDATNWANAAAFIYDPQWFAIATLRPLQEIDVGQRGDSTIGMMVEECTMEVKNPIGCGAIYNLA